MIKRFFSVELREETEFRDNSLVALSVFYEWMFWYKSTGRKCDNSLLFWACYFNSDNLYGPLFVLNTECKFDITDMKGGPVYWMAEFIRHSYTSISEIVSKVSKPSILNLWFAQHCWYYSHCLQLCCLNKINRNFRSINKTYKRT
jgi:hypothetical protein